MNVAGVAALLAAASATAAVALWFRVLHYRHLLRAAGELARIQADAALQSAALERSVFDEAPNAILVVERDGRIARSNDHARKMFGYSEAELAARRVEDLMPTRHRIVHTAYRAGFLVTRGLRAMGAGRELRALHADGREFPVEVLLSPIRGSDRDFVVATVQDITERVAAESALRMSEQRFRSVMHDAPIGLALLAPEGRLTSVNAALCEMLGRDRRSLEGAAIQSITHPDDTAEDLVQRRRLLRGDARTYRLSIRYLHADGRAVWADLSVSLVRDDFGRPIRFIAQIQDITALKSKEDAVARALREKEMLLQEVYHRVKNNLQVVSSLLSLQSRQIEDGPGRAALQDSIRRVYAMALVHEKLYQSKNLDSISLRAYVTDLCRHIAEAGNAAARRVAVITEVAPLVVGIEKAIPIGLLLNELVGNSLKHGFPGEDGGTVTARIRPAGDNAAELEVADDGCGPPAALDPAASRSLGLKLVHNLAAQLAGTVEFDRRSGLRVTVRFELCATGRTLAQSD